MSKPPARGVKAGIKADLQALKEAGAGYVAGPGTTAWSHDFLNKKPWHPLNFKNQIRKYEAEQDVALREKREEAAKAEFASEQRYLETLAHLPSKEADKYRQRQGVAWMYLKPPGMSAWEEKSQKEKAEKSQKAAEPKGAESAKQAYVADACRPASASSTEAAGPSSRGNNGPEQGWKPNLKRKERSPPRGGFDWADDNQQFVDLEEPTPGPNTVLQTNQVDDSHKRKRRRRTEGEKRGKKRKDSKRSKDEKVRRAHKESSPADSGRKELRRALRILMREGVHVEGLMKDVL